MCAFGGRCGLPRLGELLASRLEGSVRDLDGLDQFRFLGGDPVGAGFHLVGILTGAILGFGVQVPGAFLRDPHGRRHTLGEGGQAEPGLRRRFGARRELREGLFVTGEFGVRVVERASTVSSRSRTIFPARRARRVRHDA